MAGDEKESGEKVSIKDLDALVMLQLCSKLDIKLSVGGDYRYLAAHFGISYDHITRISQGDDKTHEVMSCIGTSPGNTVAKLREILNIMKRHDCVEIIDNKYY